MSHSNSHQNSSNHLDLSRHAQTRIRQRGFRENDMQVIVDAGTPTGVDGMFLLDSDVEREVCKRKREIAVLERLRGCRVVVDGRTVITIYRPSRKTEKRLLRGK